MARRKCKKEEMETFSGSYSAIPHRVIDSDAFIGATDKAKSLLFALIRQVNGRNNGRLQLVDKWLAEHGWRSKSANKKTTEELIKRGLIVRTRQGGLNMGCSWYAVTWLPIKNFVGLDISNNSYHQGIWADCNSPPTERRKPPLRDNPLPSNTGAEKTKNLPRLSGQHYPVQRGSEPNHYPDYRGGETRF
ncbi:hypothetical protein SAMN05216326_12930 [Nitrosomonas marina]|uniref:Helix-turn-helix domain-containing protein n=1 Tax=Nitrosomonas marina TaxID=917 RepID=A0A1I0EQ00_9PROT|nr:hypothetical protein [Nitrosomonas marina]SET47093.1 hypothetical protein SAMN05216326_12930 [Nitrosomonas marina]